MFGGALEVWGADSLGPRLLACTSKKREGGSYGVSRPHLDPVCTTGCACALPIPCRHRATHRRRRSPWSKQQRRQLSLCNLAAPLGPASHGADPQAGSESKETTTATSAFCFALRPRRLSVLQSAAAVSAGAPSVRTLDLTLSFPISKARKVVHD